MNCDLNVTGVEVVLIQASMSTVYIDDAKVVWLRTYGNSSVVIRDSNIYSYVTGAWLPYEDFLRFMSPSSFHQDIAMTSSRIEYMRLKTNCDAVFSDVYVDEINIVGMESNLRGTVTWGQNMTHHYDLYDRFSATQAFVVMTRGRKRVLPDVTLVLEDKDGNVVWEGATDEDGNAHFNLTFCSYYPLYEPYKYVTNYLDEWRLTAVSGDVTREETVTMFKTASPIVFEFPEDKLVLPVSNTALTYVSVTVILLATALKLRKNLYF